MKNIPIGMLLLIISTTLFTIVTRAGEYFPVTVFDLDIFKALEAISIGMIVAGFIGIALYLIIHYSKKNSDLGNQVLGAILGFITFLTYVLFSSWLENIGLTFGLLFIAYLTYLKIRE